MTNYSNLELISIVFLFFVILKLLLSILRGFWTCFLGHKLGFGIKWKTGDNVWAVITGSTDGIGLQYAKQLAEIGYNLVIISRNEDKLKATQKMLKQNYSNCKEVRIIAVDFKRTDIYQKISEELNTLDVIEVLVNNVGFLYKCPEFFIEIGSESNESYFNVNMLSLLKLIEIVLPKMVKQKHGIVINISSQTALGPVPLMTTYAATKSFVQFLSEGLSVEYESKGVIIQTVLPSVTKTNMLQDGFDDSFFLVSAEDFVSGAIKTVGIESTTFGHWKHKLMAYIMKYLTHLFGRKAVTKLSFKLMKQNRHKFYRKVGLKTD